MKKIDWNTALYFNLSGHKNRLRVYHLTWLRNKILNDDPESKRRQVEMLKTEEACKAIDKLTGCEHFSVRKSHFIFTIGIQNFIPFTWWSTLLWKAEKGQSFNFIYKNECISLPHFPEFLCHNYGCYWKNINWLK